MPRCLYNGIELPQLPEWDKTLYPYAFVYKIISSKYGLVVCNSQPYYNGDNVCIDGAGLMCGVSVDSDKWVAPHTASYKSYGSVFWTNTDILNSDGTIYLAASDPIPVSTFIPDPSSLTMGWLVGRRIAGQRK